MSRWSRRDFLKTAAVLGAASSLGDRLSWASRPPRPRMLVQIHLVGGMDAILTTDPKRRRQVDANVEVSYEESAILERGGIALGPLLHPLAEHASRLAILNGVVCSTVSHQTGALQVKQMRREVLNNGLTLVGTVGAATRGEAPLSEVRFGMESPMAGRSLTLLYGLLKDPADGLLAQLAEVATDPRSHPLLSTALDNARRGCGGDAHCAPMTIARELLDRWPHARLPPVPHLDTASPSRLAAADMHAFASIFRDSLFMLEHRLTAGIFILAPELDQLGWDTHAWNDKQQASCMQVFLPALLYFLKELGQRRTPDGILLSDQVGVVISSELGRFPFANDYHGKDHLPEHPAILIGPGLRPGCYGETDRRMLSTAISPQHGRARSSPKDFVPTLDDLGTTILHWFGVEDAASRGYLGRRLDFLLS